MAIFKKSKHDYDLELDSTTQPTLQEPADFSPSTASQPAVNSAPKKPAHPQSYGIEDAIELMRKLPNVNSEITITVVKKTLESANIQVEEIISDAERKESQIEKRTTELSQEIAQLQERIERLNGEITELTADLKETSKVKVLLVGASESEKQPPKTASEPAKKIKEENVPQTNANSQPKENVTFTTEKAGISS